jgi:hypothetical protein
MRPAAWSRVAVTSTNRPAAMGAATLDHALLRAVDHEPDLLRGVYFHVKRVQTRVLG